MLAALNATAPAATDSTSASTVHSNSRTFTSLSAGCCTAVVAVGSGSLSPPPSPPPPQAAATTPTRSRIVPIPKSTRSFTCSLLLNRIAYPVLENYHDTIGRGHSVGGEAMNSLTIRCSSVVAKSKCLRAAPAPSPPLSSVRPTLPLRSDEAATENSSAYRRYMSMQARLI